MEIVLFICMNAYMQIEADCRQCSLPVALFEPPPTSYLRQSPLNQFHPDFTPTPSAKADRLCSNEVQRVGDAPIPALAVSHRL